MRLSTVVAMALLARSTGWAQQSAVPLKPASAILPVEFTAITSARELSDGRVLISDPLDNRLVVADFTTGAVTQVGRVGNGPKEYSRAFPAIALSGDSSLMANGLSKQWLILDGAKIVKSLAPDAKVIRSVSSAFGADSRGNVLARVCAPATTCGPTSSDHDSASLVLVSIKTGKADTVARVWRDPSLSNAGMASRRRSPYLTFETALLARDGWLAVFRVNPSRVDWRSPSGQWSFGPPLPFDPIRIDRREKLAFMPLKIIGGRPNETDADYDWPETIPPWSQSGRSYSLFTTWEGKLLLVRTPTADHPEPRFDVINHRGQIERQIQLGKDENVVGFGNGTVYISFSDSDDIKRLRRHPWP